MTKNDKSTIDPNIIRDMEKAEKTVIEPKILDKLLSYQKDHIINIIEMSNLLV
jgi:hypothetical protein